MKKEPIRHHYIPQFILRNFCNKEGYVKYLDKSTNEITLRKPRDVFMEKNLYRDEINHVENPTKIENDLARYESEISDIIKKKFLVGNRIILTKEEDEKLKLFFFIMGFRSCNTKFQLSRALTEESIKMYSIYQEDRDFQDMWKRNLGYLVNCRSAEDVFNHKEIDDPIKMFVWRDVLGVLGLYLVVVEKREGECFIIGDAYPTAVTGTTVKGVQLPLYSICPISPNRVILVVGNGVKEAPRNVLGFRPLVLHKPQWTAEEQSISIHVKQLYPEEVGEINQSIVNAAKTGLIFYEDK